MNPLKPVEHPVGAEARYLRTRVHQHLLNVTDLASRDLECTGASFVLMGISVWLSELHELSPRAVTEMLNALAVVHNPASTDTAKIKAEKKRVSAVRKLLAQADLANVPPVGSA